MDQKDGLNELDAIKARLRQELRESPDGLYGAQVGSLVKRASPGFSLASYGVPKLRDFVSGYLSDVLVEAARSGQDIIYRGIEPIPRQESVTGAGFWRAWVSPGSPMANFINRRTGALDVRPLQSEPLPDEFKLLPLPATEHKELARAFVNGQSNLDVESLSILLAALASESDWWRHWQKALRGPCSSFASPWNRFRQAELERRLERTLAEHGLEGATAAVLLEMRRDRDADRQTKVSRQAPMTPRSADSDLHMVVHRAIDALSPDELRQLWLPLGIVLDAQKRRT